MYKRLLFNLFLLTSAHASNSTLAPSKATIGIGITAGILGSGFNLPQLVKIYRTKNVDSISTPTQIAVGLIAVLWTIYGALKDDWILITSSAVSAAIQVPILIGVWLYQKRDLDSW